LTDNEDLLSQIVPWDVATNQLSDIDRHPT
jgi:hypothetical protein